MAIILAILVVIAISALAGCLIGAVARFGAADVEDDEDFA